MDMPIFQDHKTRRAEILRTHPEVKSLIGPSITTAWLAAAAILLQFAVAAFVAGQAWWVIVLAAYAIGAFNIHCLNSVYHECTHNLVFRTGPMNKAFAIVANLPSLVPSAVAFRYYHMMHHRYLCVRGKDPDLPTPWEIRVVGHSSWRKFLWLCHMPLTYSVIHPLHTGKRPPLDRWLIANIAAVALTSMLVVYLGGWPAAAYLLLSAYFAIGPHPAAAHLLQEHVNFAGHYETASYQGPLNLISANIGYHLEHHDFAAIAGPKLPRLRRMAAPFYAGQYVHKSRAGGLWQFILDRRIGLDSRLIRAADAAPSAI